ncbi:MAG: putative metal-binding motif-containing protein [Deltaproteobacteria bacterium]|nr:putative metal-binding motif-containing protein [Deltaproteobacteria bacterium]
MRIWMRMMACSCMLALLLGCTSTNEPGDGYTPPDLASNSDALTIQDMPLGEDDSVAGDFPTEGRWIGYVFQAREGEIYDIVLRRTSGSAHPAVVVYQFDSGWGDYEVYATADAETISIGGWSVPADGTYLVLVDVEGSDHEGSFDLTLTCTGGCNDPYTCSSDADCAPGEVCWNGLCFADGVECQSNADCLPHEACENGFCVVICVPAVEICDGLDNDCDGIVDEGCDMYCNANSDCAAGMVCIDGLCVVDFECRTDADCPVGTWCIAGVCTSDDCADADGDGYLDCARDCDDSDASVHPGAAELCDGLDNDCDGLVDEGCGGLPCQMNADCPRGQVCLGGLCTPMACSSDSDCPAGQVCWDGICSGAMACQADSDCPPGTICDAGLCVSACEDLDGDGYCSPADCDDFDPAVGPGMPEICFDGLDNDCDGIIDENCNHLPCSSDMDCPAGQVCINGRCNSDYACQSDSDCPLGMYCDAATATCRVVCEDMDGDGYCAPYDCDDADPSVGPGMPEICDGMDNDCDGEVDENCGSGCSSDIECDPGFICVDGVCIVECATDADGDGFVDVACGGLDCDDFDSAIHPAAAEVCDGRDNDCDGRIDEYCGQACSSDNDCAAGQICVGGVCMAECMSDSDCAPGEYCMDGLCVPACVPEIEICDGIDNDCDGIVDEGCGGECTDGETMSCGSDVGECVSGLQTCSGGVWSECVGAVYPAQETCDGLDNDCDGDVDEVCGLACNSDSDCAMGQVCMDGVCQDM